MTADAYEVRRNPHSRIYRWQWRCLHTQQTGIAPPSRCTQWGLGRSEADAEAGAAAHAASHTSNSPAP